MSLLLSLIPNEQERNPGSGEEVCRSAQPDIWHRTVLRPDVPVGALWRETELSFMQQPRAGQDMGFELSPACISCVPFANY